MHDGTSVDAANVAELQLGWHRKMLALGIKPLVWGSLRTDPSGEAALAVKLTRKWGVAYVANPEFEYHESQGPEALKRSRSFVLAFRLRAPLMNAAVCSFGYGWKHPTLGHLPSGLDWKPWRLARFRTLPQAYMGDGTPYPLVNVFEANAVAFPPAWVHPVLPNFGAGSSLASMQRQLEGLRRLRPLGFAGGIGLYLGDQARREQFELLARALKDA